MDKKIIAPLIAGLFFSVSAFAVPATNSQNFHQGLYMGLQGGYASVDPGDGPKNVINSTFDFFTENTELVFQTKDVDEHGFGGRIFLGWNFNPYLALETGFNVFPHNNYKYSGSFRFEEGEPIFSFKTTSESESEYAVDLMAKATFPFSNLSADWGGLNVYGKAGIAYIHDRLKFKGEFGGEDLIVTNESHGNIRPAFGLGVGYCFDQNFSMDFSWTTIIGKDKIGIEGDFGDPGNTDNLTNLKDFAATTNLFAVGFIYKFPGI